MAVAKVMTGYQWELLDAIIERLMALEMKDREAQRQRRARIKAAHARIHTEEAVRL